MLKNKNWGAVLIMIAATLWALDALLRTQLTFALPSYIIVLLEHIVGFIILSPFFVKAISKYKKLTWQDWGIVILMSVVSSVLGTLLFTEALTRSFAINDFATPILLQKLQPLFVVLLSVFLLKEKITLRFLLIVPIALIGSYMISFGTESVALDLTTKLEVVLLALGAAAAWGIGTILSKRLLTKLNFSEATSLRFLIAIPIALLVTLLYVGPLGRPFDASSLQLDHIIRLVIISFTTGAGAILIYYKGLKTTRASVAAFAELTFPIVSILIAVSYLNPYGEPQVFSLANQFGVVLLLLSIILITFENDHANRENED